MAPDFPSDLIRNIQIGLRYAAGIPSYDPDDPALPSVPSIGEAVHSLDPSLPDYLRCRRCHGGLCRGISSTLCIFCGTEQRMEGISRTIAFQSTAGYRRFLESLSLDGSEIVNFEAESKDSTKGQDSAKGDITLSNILDFELVWPRHVEESDNGISIKAPSQVALANLSGINLDNLFSDQKKYEVSSRSSDSHSTSNDPRLSAHDAYISSAQLDTILSGTRNETATRAQNTTTEPVKPREHDVNPHVNLSSSSQKFSCLDEEHSLDAANSCDAKGGDPDDDFTDWETDFQSANSVTFEANFKPIDSFQNFTDFQSANSTEINLPVQTDLFQNTSNFHSNNPTDLAVESRTIDVFQNSTVFQSSSFETVAMESGLVDLFQKSESRSTDWGMSVTDPRPSGQLTNSGVEKSDPSTNIVHDAVKAWFEDDMSSLISTEILKEADQLESTCSTSGGEVKNVEETPVRVNYTQDDFWLGNSANELNNRNDLSHHDDDLVDDWQDFTTSINPLENFSEAKLGDLEDLDFGSFVQSVSVSAALNDLQRSSDGNSIEAGDSDANRINQSNDKMDKASVFRGLDVIKNIPEASNDMVDMLLAQMPDLSFMLEESLCIPKKPSNSGLNT